MQERKTLFEEDPRYRQCNKEVLIVLVFFVVNVLIIGGISLLLGYKKPVDQIQIVGGFPAWFFYGCIIGTIVLSLIPFFMIRYFFKDMSLEAENRQEAQK